MRFPLESLVTTLALLVYLWSFVEAGRMRARHKVVAPAVTGHPEFERAFRVQQNTLEQIVLFLPAMWIFATTLDTFWAALLGLVWVVGRIVYALGYYAAPEKRGTGFMISLAATALLILGALFGSLRVVFVGI